MKKVLNKQKGFTIVEVLVTITILSIISIVFLNLFTTGFVNIFSSGNRNDAVLLASDLFELLYEKNHHTGSIDSIKNLLEGSPYEGQYISGKDKLYEYVGKDFNFFIDDSPIVTYQNDEVYLEIPGCAVTIVAFYLNGEKFASLTSFIGGDDI